jgi:hypothetical protein
MAEDVVPAWVWVMHPPAGSGDDGELVMAIVGRRLGSLDDHVMWSDPMQRYVSFPDMPNADSCADDPAGDGRFTVIRHSWKDPRNLRNN